MSLDVEVFGVKVSCDFPEQAVAVAAAAAVMKKPAIKDVMEHSKGPITLFVNEVKFVCETLEVAASVVLTAALGAKPKRKAPDSLTNQRRSVGTRNARISASIISKEFSITDDEARAALRDKRLAMQMANKKKPSPKEVLNAVRTDLSKKKKK